MQSLKNSSFARVSFVILAVALFAATGAHAAEHPHAKTKHKPMPKCEEAKAGGPEQVVRTLYKVYPYGGGSAVENEPRAVLEKFFDKKLAALLAEERECFTNLREICALDWSIMYAAQDGEITDLRVCAMDGATHQVRVLFRNFGEPQIFDYPIERTSDGWRISDILVHLDGGEGSLADTLSGYFSDLASAWKTAKTPPEKAPGGALPKCEKPKAGGPEDMVAALYEEYPWKGEEVILSQPPNVLLKYFDANLAGLLVKDREKRIANDDGPSYMPNFIINYDMSHSQAIRGFQICAMDAPTKTVRAQFWDGGDPVIVTFKFVDTAAGWRISDIGYRGPTDAGDTQPHDWSLGESLSD